VVDPTIPDLDRREALLGELTAWLATVPVQLRTQTVLHRLVGLDEVQVAEATGSWTETPAPPLGAVDLHDALDALPVPSAPVAEVLALAAARRRRRRRALAGGAVVVLVVTGLATWVGTRPPAPEPPAPAVSREINLAEISWYANQELHLDEVTVELPDLHQVLAVPDGAVVARGDTEVLLVDGDGVVTRLGARLAGSTIVGSQERGWVAWLEEGELVAYDTLARRSLGGTEVTDDAELVALDQDRVYWNSQQGHRFWQPPDATTAGFGELLDVSSGVRAEQWTGRTIRVSQPLFDLRFDLPGVGAVLSADGDHVLTRVDQPDPGTVRLYDTRSGQSLPTGLRRTDLVLEMAFGPDDTVVYVVEHRPNSEAGNQDLRLSTTGGQLLLSCFLGAPPPDAFRPTICETVTQFARNSGRPLLAR